MKTTFCEEGKAKHCGKAYLNSSKFGIPTDSSWTSSIGVDDLILWQGVNQFSVTCLTLRLLKVNARLLWYSTDSTGQQESGKVIVAP